MIAAAALILAAAIATIATILLEPSRRDRVTGDALAVGIADGLIAALARHHGLRVRPTNSVLRFEGQAVDPTVAGRDHRADYVVAGTVQDAFGRFRVSVQLVRVEDGSVSWGEQLELARHELLEVQDVVAPRVATALDLGAEQSLARSATAVSDADARELYLKGTALLARHRRQEMLDAVEAFGSALEMAPDDARIRAGLAMACAEIHLRFAVKAEAPQWSECAQREARKALDLDPSSAESHLALATVFRNTEFAWEETLEEGARALELNPSLAQAHFYRAGAFYHLGLVELAEREVSLGEAVDPSDAVEPLRLRGVIALFAGRFYEAIGHFEAVDRLSSPDVSQPYLALSQHYAGRRTEAEGEMVRLVDDPSASTSNRARATLASFRAAAGAREEARALVKTIPESGYMDHHVAYGVATTLAQLDNDEEALRWLTDAVETGFQCAPWFARDPLLAPFRSHHGFSDCSTRSAAAPIRRERDTPGEQLLTPVVAPSHRECENGLRIRDGIRRREDQAHDQDLACRIGDEGAWVSLITEVARMDWSFQWWERKGTSHQERRARADLRAE